MHAYVKYIQSQDNKSPALDDFNMNLLNQLNVHIKNNMLWRKITHVTRTILRL